MIVNVLLWAASVFLAGLIAACLLLCAMAGLVKGLFQSDKK